MSSKSILRLDWCSHEAAKFACERWHYSHTIPSASVKIGVWEDLQFKGVVIFGRGASSEIGSPFGLQQTEICELVRVAIGNHVSPVSRILAISCRMLKTLSPGLKLLVSFADTAQGHHGGIYQAAGWFFVGSTETHAYRVNGRIVHPKTLHSKYGVGGQSIPWLKTHVDPKATRIIAGVKHKYVMPCSTEIAKQISVLALPYPKRPKQATAGDHPTSGGAAPTRTLHLPDDEAKP